MIAFIDAHRDAHRVEPICRVLPIAPSTYHAHVARRADPTKASARLRRDKILSEHIRRVHEANFALYGVRKVWRQLLRESIGVARCTVASLMRRMGLKGVVRGREVRTTIAEKATPCPADRVNWQFRAARPNVPSAAGWPPSLRARIIRSADDGSQTLPTWRLGKDSRTWLS